MENSKEITLQAKDLSIGYRQKKKEETVASDINFALKKGELTGLVGANGAGKSTLLRTLAKVQPALSGSIYIQGENQEKVSSETLAETVSVVLTEQPASKNLTVNDLISLGRQPYTNWLGTLTEADREQVRYAMNATEITELQHRKCYELSDGQLQRVLIARALAQDTPVILLDEPTTHLDIYHRASILNLLKNLSRDTSKSILFSTHDIDLAIQLCDKMLVMDKHTTHFGNPCELIDTGCFSSLFPKNLIDFDKETGRFRIIK
jgi:iron complex transport system ATP-binding protein